MLPNPIYDLIISEQFHPRRTHVLPVVTAPVRRRREGVLDAAGRLIGAARGRVAGIVPGRAAEPRPVPCP